MSQYGYGAPQPPHGGPAGYGPGSAQNLQFYPSSYSPAVSGHATPQQASYGYGGPSSSYSGGGVFGSSFGGPGVSGRMNDQGGLRAGWLAAFSTEGYDGEPPLLEELGINFDHIRAKTLAVLNPFTRIDQHLMDDSDLAGPLLFFLLFGFFLLFSGRLHFGYIYGLALLGCSSLHFIFGLMSPDPSANSGIAHPGAPPYSSSPAYPEAAGGSAGPSVPGGVDKRGGPVGSSHHLSSTLTLARSSSVLGYCLLPLVATSAVGVVLPMDTPLGIVLTSGAIMWCTYSASAMFCAVGRMRGMRALVAYPIFLFYGCFGIMGIFSSRGSGTGALARATTGGGLGAGM